MILLRSTAFALPVLALGACNGGDSAQPPAAAPVESVAAPEGTSWADRVEPTAEGGMRMGNPDAPIKLVEYGSLSCPVCARFAQDGYERLAEHYVGSGRVSYEFRSMAIHPQDVPLTLLVNCGAREAWFPLVHQIYANFDAMQAPLGDQGVQARANAALQGPPERRMTGLADALGYPQFFAARGLPVDKANACLADRAAAGRISELTNDYAGDGVTGTPTFLVNGRKLDTVRWSDVEEALIGAGAG